METPEYKQMVNNLKQLTDRLKQQNQVYQQRKAQAKAQMQPQGAGTPATNGAAINTGSAAAAIAAGRPGSQGQGAASGQPVGSVVPRPQPVPQPSTSAPPPMATTIAQGGQATQQASFNPRIIQHVKEFDWCNPPDKPVTTAEGEAWLNEVKKQYLQALSRMDTVTAELRKLEQAINNKYPDGQNIPAEYRTRKAQLEQHHAAAKTSADRIRAHQGQLKAQRTSTGVGGGQAAATATAPGVPQSQAAGATSTVKTEAGTGAGTVPTADGPKPFNLQLPGQRGQQNNNQQPGAPNQPNATAINPALEAARNAANIKQGSMSPSLNQAPQQSNPVPGTAFPAPANPQQIGHQQPGQPHAPQRPSLNTQQANNPAFAQSMPVLPQSAHPPAPLTHNAAMNAAARGYSNPSATPMSATPGSYQQRDQTNHNPKLPIPKNLPQSVLDAPRPVSMGQPSRPTLAGPSNGAGGMLGQPVLEKHGGILVEGDGGGVLSRNKLGELVREVGGPEESLTPEAEDVSDTLSFHDGIAIKRADHTNNLISRSSSASPTNSPTPSSLQPAAWPSSATRPHSPSKTSRSYLSATTTSESPVIRSMKRASYESFSLRRVGIRRWVPSAPPRLWVGAAQARLTSGLKTCRRKLRVYNHGPWHEVRFS